MIEDQSKIKEKTKDSANKNEFTKNFENERLHIQNLIEEIEFLSGILGKNYENNLNFFDDLKTSGKISKNLIF